LKGLSPKDNRDIPPLRYGAVHQLKADFPDATIVINGGLTGAQDSMAALEGLDGVMLGRAAWHTPRVLSDISIRLWPQVRLASNAQVVDIMTDYARH
ncbi:MAG: tRNA dihydrouridine(20/20a) synthase DusA, partial [Comamonadaceae bacterium]